MQFITRNFFLISILLSLQLQAGDLDTTFGVAGTGIVTTSIHRFDYIQSSTIQADDKIIVVGTTNGFTSQLVTARYTNNGTLDTSFNTNGIQELSLGYAAMGNAIDLQNDGKIVSCGTIIENQSNILTTRLTITGTLDSTYNSQGYLSTATGIGASPYSLKIQNDSKIVIGGAAVLSSPNAFIARFNSDGSLDNTLGGNGMVLTSTGLQTSINEIALQSNGKIVAVGYCRNGTVTKFIILRYNSNGTLDSTFGTNGITTTTIGLFCIAKAVTIQGDGKIIVAGYTTNEFNRNEFAITRYNTNGSLDTSFNSTGIITEQIQYNDIAHAITLQNDGKIIVGGTSQGDKADDFALVRYLNSGSIDTTFGQNGITTTTINGSDSQSQINSLVLQSNGKIIASGFSNKDFALARYSA